MIALISGVCRIGRALKRPADGPFSAPQEVEERLVRRGVARYVSNEDSGVAAGADSANSPVSPGVDTANPPVSPLERGDLPASDTQEEESPQPLRGHFDERFLQSMTNAKLKELAEDLGLDTSSMHKKADYVAAILQTEVEAGDEQIPGLEDGKYASDSELPNLNLGAEDLVT